MKRRTPSPRHPLGQAYERLRLEARDRDLDRLSRQGLSIDVVGVEDPLASAKDPRREREVLELAQEADEGALEALGFRADPRTLPGPGDLVARPFRRRAGRIGSALTRVSELSCLWIDLTRHTSFGLEPVYFADDLVGRRFYLPGVDEEGRPLPLGDPERGDLWSVEIPKDDPALAHWLHLNDPTEVRKRAAWTRRLLVEELSELARARRRPSIRICGLACGAAHADLAAVGEVVARYPDLRVHLDLIDVDRGALRLAEMAAQATGFGSGSPGAGVWRRLVSAHGRSTIDLVPGDVTDSAELQRIALRDGGAGYDVVEATGLVEYFSDERDPEDPHYPLSGYSLLSAMRGMTRRGGLALFAHMTSYHNILRILGVVGWARLRPKSLTALTTMTGEVFGGCEIDYTLLESSSYLFASVRETAACESGSAGQRLASLAS